MYLIIEGIDGSGKDSVADLLVKHFQNLGANPLRIHEPDESLPGGEELRHLMKTGDGREAYPGLFMANRMSLHTTKVLPALVVGRPVISVRSFVSTLVYQQEHWPLDWLFEIHRMLPAKPDVIVILDVDPAVGLERVSGRGVAKEVYERLDIQTRNRQRYLDLIADERIHDFLAPGGRIIVQGTTGVDVQAIHTKIVQALGGIH